jgi:protein-tyrosine phosphatase
VATDGNNEMSTVLFVCTGNICRSPTAAALLASRSASTHTAISVDSAGTADLKAPAPPEVIVAGQEVGIDLADHRGRLITPEDVNDAALILGMARRHVREVATIGPGAWPRTFTLREIVRRGQSMGPRNEHQTLEDWLVFVHHGRRMVDLHGKSRQDDIADPLGGSLRDYRRAAETISVLVTELADLAWPVRPDSDQ